MRHRLFVNSFAVHPQRASEHRKGASAARRSEGGERVHVQRA
ncbi:hypothetical protein ABR738_34080 [Streptomyces sp. Edi4]